MTGDVFRLQGLVCLESHYMLKLKHAGRQHYLRCLQKDGLEAASH